MGVQCKKKRRLKELSENGALQHVRRFLRFTSFCMANRDELIQQFIDTTGASADQAKFFLEMAGWELKVKKSIAVLREVWVF